MIAPTRVPRREGENARQRHPMVLRVNFGTHAKELVNGAEPALHRYRVESGLAILR